LITSGWRGLYTGVSPQRPEIDVCGPTLEDLVQSARFALDEAEKMGEQYYCNSTPRVAAKLALAFLHPGKRIATVS